MIYCTICLSSYFSVKQGKTYQIDNLAYICTSYGFSKYLLIELIGKGHLTKNTTQSTPNQDKNIWFLNHVISQNYNLACYSFLKITPKFSIKKRMACCMRLLQYSHQCGFWNSLYVCSLNVYPSLFYTPKMSMLN